ncbi:MAG: hypothetical protein J1E85_08775 [Ruminococcus sp.]|nr:hypothetical protein [Ruminococcus sp.]
MSRKNKLLIVLLSVIFCFSVFSLSALAVSDDEGQGGYSDVTPGDEQGGDQGNGDENVDIPPEESGSDSDNNDNNAGDNNSDYPDENNGNDNSGDNSYGYGDNNNNGYSDNNGGYDSNYNYSDYNGGYEGQSGYEQIEEYYGDYSYVGGGQTYIPPENIAPSASLYDSKGSINEKTLNNSDWNDIAERLKNTSNSDDDGDDFAFIQKNNSNSDNGGWMLIASILCFAFSAAGIVYFIVLTVQNKKKCSFASATDNGRVSKSSAGRDYYGDGYKSNSRKSSNRYSKFDTAEVTLPKSTQGKRYKNDIRRYK